MSGRSEKQATFVITNYNGRKNLERCLPHVLEAARSGELCDEVLVIDDCSTDDSLEFLAREFPEVRVIPLQKRSSFLGAANEGFRQARNRYVALLSNDMAPAPDFLDRLLPHFEDPAVFAAHASLVGPEGQLESERSVGRFLLGNFKVVNTANPTRGLSRLLLPSSHDSRFSLFSGACGIFDREKFLSLGGLDPIYLPFYWEDVDLCFRAWRNGWTTVSEPSCRVAHYHQELGTIRNNFARSYVRTIERRNRFLFLWSNIDNPIHLGSHLMYLMANLVGSVFIGRLGFYESFFGSLKLLPDVLERRRRRNGPKLSDEDIFAAVLGGEVAGAEVQPSVKAGRAVANFEMAGPLSPN